MRDIAYTFSTATFSLNNVPVGTDYDLYLYSQNGAFKSSQTEFIIGTTVHTAINTATSVFVLDTNYVLFHGLSPDGLGAINVTMNNLSPSGASFDGFQLLELPEPASMSLLGLGGLLLLRRRR